MNYWTLCRFVPARRQQNWLGCSLWATGPITRSLWPLNKPLECAPNVRPQCVRTVGARAESAAAGVHKRLGDIRDWCRRQCVLCHLRFVCSTRDVPRAERCKRAVRSCHKGTPPPDCHSRNLRVRVRRGAPRRRLLRRQKCARIPLDGRRALRVATDSSEIRHLVARDTRRTRLRRVLHPFIIHRPGGLEVEILDRVVRRG